MSEWLEEPESYWDKEMAVDNEACPKCGEIEEQTLHAGRHETLYTGTAECQACDHKWELEIEMCREYDYYD